MKCYAKDGRMQRCEDLAAWTVTRAQRLAHPIRSKSLLACSDHLVAACAATMDDDGYGAAQVERIIYHKKGR